MSRRRTLLVLLGFSLGFRLLVAGLVGLRHSERGDAVEYRAIARNLADSGDYSIDGERPTLRRPPLLPLLMALSYKTYGDEAALLPWINALALTGMTVLLAAMATRQSGFQGACFVIVAASLDLFLVDFQTQIFSEPLFLASFSVGLCGVDAWRRAPSSDSAIRAGALSGLFFGLATLIRPNPLYLLLALSPWALSGPRQRRIGLVSAALVFALTLSPWVLRNFWSFNRFVASTSIQGEVLWGANNPEVAQGPLAGRWARPPMIPGQEALDELGLSDFQTRAAARWAADSGPALVGHGLRKVLCFWGLLGPERGLALSTLILLTSGPVILLAGLALASPLMAWPWPERCLGSRAPALWILAYSQIVTLVSYGDERQRAFVTPILLLLAAQMWTAALRRHRRRASRAALAALSG
jgi:hypothetical protein